MTVPSLSRGRAPRNRKGILVLVLLLGGLALAPPTHAQAPLHRVNKNTTVSEISFRFVDTQTFAPDRLKEQLATRAPGFFTGLRNRFSFLPGLTPRSFEFNPIALQKDVVRLRQFYQQNGFPAPQIDYPASQLDTTANTIHVIFTIKEGTPLTVRTLTFRNGDDTEPLAPQLSASLREKWERFRASPSVQPGERYTEFKKTTIEDNVGTWLRNQGYAFAQVQSKAQVDTAGTAVDLRILADPGPLAHVSEILVEGNESVSKDIVRRELPFAVGDRFSAADVFSGQQQLFDLNLFRVVIADVPDQSRDSTVTVRYRVRETKLRAYSGKVGYGTQPGVTLEGSWRHRNFRGDARTLNVGVIADTGYPENPPSFIPSFLSRSATQDPNRRFKASVTLRQPYLFVDRLSGSVSPFIQERINPNVGAESTRFLSLSERQIGLNTKLTYDFLPFRTLSLEHSFARVTQFRSSAADADQGDDLFDSSVFALNGTFGKADDFINPSKGVLFRPSLQVGGFLFASGVDFIRLGGGLSGYLPVSDEIELAGRLSGGVLRPFGTSRENLTAAPGTRDGRTRTYQDRFSEYLFYAGGGSDVRGWQSRLAGGKVLRRSSIARTDYVYRPIGARLKVGINLEARLPFPGLGSSWRTALFLDGAYLESDPLTLVPPSSAQDVVKVDDGAITSPSSGILAGAGGGMRYKTPFGFLRFDVAYKLTPDKLDLRRPGALGNAADEKGVDDPVAATPTRPIRRFRLHFGIGRSF